MDRRYVASSTILTAVVTGLAAALIPLIPPGEAPDEPAHIAYVAYLRQHKRLPPIQSSDASSYEAYQPPIAYATAALLTAAVGAPPPSYTFDRNPDFDFEPGERAFLQTRNSPQDTVSVTSIRAANLIWMPVLVLSTLSLCQRLSESHRLACVATIPFVTSPQVLFVHATFGNDAAVMALAAAATAALAFVVSDESPRRWQVVLGGGLAGLALWAKASAALFFPVIVAVAFVQYQRRRAIESGLLLGAYSLVVFGYFILEFSRSGSILPTPPTGWSGDWDSLLRLVRQPRWVASTWLSFWGKFGWFNVLLPLPLYLWFLAPTATVANGVLAARRRGKGTWLLLLILALNVSLFAFYLVKVDWQPQGRYLFPSLAALAGLAALGASPFRRRYLRWSLAASTVFSLAVACASVWWVFNVYRQ